MMASNPTIPEGVVDEASADAFLDSVTSSPEEPEGTTEAPVTDPAEDAEGPLRDELGRFSSDEPPVEAVKPPEGEAADDDAPPEPVAQAAAEAETGLTDEAWNALPALQYRAEGQSWEIPGSKVYEDGDVHIPSEQMPAILRLIQQGQSHQGSYQATLKVRDDKTAAMTLERDSAQAALNEISTKLEELISVDGAFETWIEDQKGNWALLKAKAEGAAQRTELDAMRETTTREAAERAEAELVPQMQNRLGEMVSHFGAQAGFDQATQQSIYDRLIQTQYLDQIFPKREGGGRSENPDLVAQEMLYLAGFRGPSQPTTVAETQQAAVVKEPAKPVSRRRRPPPTASSKKSGEPASSGEKLQVPKFKTTEEADAWVAAL